MESYKQCGTQSSVEVVANHLQQVKYIREDMSIQLKEALST